LSSTIETVIMEKPQDARIPRFVSDS